MDVSSSPEVKTSPSNTRGGGSTSGRETKIPDATRPPKYTHTHTHTTNIKDFKNGPRQKKKTLKIKNQFSTPKCTPEQQHDS